MCCMRNKYPSFAWTIGGVMIPAEEFWLSVDWLLTACERAMGGEREYVVPAWARFSSRFCLVIYSSALREFHF